MVEEFIEATLLWSTAGPDPSAEAWFKDRGFEVMKMKAGLLIRSSRNTFESAFGAFHDIERPIDLPVPEVLKKHVSSIRIPKLPKLQS
jgi:hypothetical protein